MYNIAIQMKIYIGSYSKYYRKTMVILGTLKIYAYNSFHSDMKIKRQKLPHEHIDCCHQNNSEDVVKNLPHMAQITALTYCTTFQKQIKHLQKKSKITKVGINYRVYFLREKSER